MSDPTPYLSGLILRDRRVVVVGGGHVAQRRVPMLINAGARVTVVSPVVTPALEGMGAEVTLTLRRFEPTDLDGAWYVIAATDDPAANALVSEAAEERRIFCVRSDDATQATAWTPAVGRHGTATIGVLGNREPHQSATLRDDIVTALRDGHLTASGALDRTPGVVLVGGGPGDPELVTVAARHALASADVVVADRLAPRELLDELGPGVELIDVAKLPGDGPRSRSTSTSSSSTAPGRASGWCASRGVTTSSSAGATRRSSPARPRGSRSRSSPGSPRRWRCRASPRSR